MFDLRIPETNGLVSHKDKYTYFFSKCTLTEIQKHDNHCNFVSHFEITESLFKTHSRIHVNNVNQQHRAAPSFFSFSGDFFSNLSGSFVIVNISVSIAGIKGRGKKKMFSLSLVSARWYRESIGKKLH